MVSVDPYQINIIKHATDQKPTERNIVPVIVVTVILSMSLFMLMSSIIIGILAVFKEPSTVNSYQDYYHNTDDLISTSHIINNNTQEMCNCGNCIEYFCDPSTGICHSIN